jgi:ACT domain-containing protein
MTNILQNGDFMSPDITGFIPAPYQIQYYNTFVQGEKDVFVWIGSDSLSLQNNDNGITSFGYPDIKLENYAPIYQYVSFENTSFLYQTINCTKTGIYNLYFLYVSRPNYPLNNIQIFLNKVLLDVITVPQANWTQYNISFPISTTGNYTLSFQAQSDNIEVKNLLYNGDFSLPLFSNNTLTNYSAFTTQQTTDFYWTIGISGSVRIINGVPNPSFINPSSLIGYTQSCYLLNNSSIQQSFTVNFPDSYILSFYYSLRTGVVLSNMEIYINDILIDTITTNPTNWSRYINTVYLNSGINTIKFLGVGVSSYAIIITGIKIMNGLDEVKPPAIAITNIRLFEPPSIVGGETVVYNNNFKSTNINGSLNVIDYTTSGKKILGQITTNYLICKNNLTMLADGTQSIYFKDISGYSIGRIFGNRKQFYLDYHDIMSFRYCTGVENTLKGTILNLGPTGIIVNSTFSSSTYNLDVYGNGGAYIRGPLKVMGDITYQDTTTLTSVFSGYNTSITSISGKINTINGNINSISGLVATANTNITSINSIVATANTNITSISGRVATANTNITSISGLVATANTNITSISGLVSGHTTNITSISGLVATANTNITTISGQLNTLLNGTRIYQATQSAYVAFPSVTYPAFSTSMTVSNIPIGLYIAKYYIYVLNPLTTGTTTISNYQTSISDGSGNSIHYWNDCFPYTLTYSTTKTSNAQTFSQTTIINNTKVQNYTLSIGIFFTGNALYWGSSLSPLYSYFQLIKI